MPRRPIDLEFAVDERLWRRIEVNHIDKQSRVKANALRLQVSVVRDRYGTLERVPSGKFNGVAETTAGAVSSVTEGQVRVVCIDEPTDIEPGHALIAFVVAPGEQAPAEVVNATRMRLASGMRVVRAPSRVE